MTTADLNRCADIARLTERERQQLFADQNLWWVDDKTTAYQLTAAFLEHRLEMAWEAFNGSEKRIAPHVAQCREALGRLADAVAAGEVAA